jgi:pyridoxal 5'-phosphate synthase pdxT subunit
LDNLDGIVLPGGESTAMGLIGTTSSVSSSSPLSSSALSNSKSLWDCLRDFGKNKPMWGTCAGMILLAEQCIGTSAVIENGQSLIGGMNVLVCRNYFGSQVSSFEMPTPAPPPSSPPTSSSSESSQYSPTSVTKTTKTSEEDKDSNNNNSNRPFPGIFIRAPAILSAGPDVEVLGRVLATPCRQAALVLQTLEDKIAQEGTSHQQQDNDATEEKKESASIDDNGIDDGNINNSNTVITLPGATEDGTGARQVICAVRRDNLLCTAFHPELTDDYRWHQYFVYQMVLPNRKSM